MNGNTLKSLIEKSGMTQGDVAKRFGISPQQLNNMFKQTDIRSSFVEKFAEILGVPISSLYGEQAQTTASPYDALIEKDKHIERLLGIIENMTKDYGRGANY